MVYDQDWYIDSNQNISVSDQTIILNGNLIINGSGKLLLNNVTLIFNNTIINQFNIVTKSNGTLQIIDSIIKSTPVSACSKIIFENESIGLISGTNIQTLGTFTGDYSGVIIRSNKVKLNNNSIENCTFGVLLDSDSTQIKDTTISNCQIGISGQNVQGELDNCIFDDCEKDISFGNASEIVIIDTELSNIELSNCSNIIQKVTLHTQIIFNDPSIMPIKGAEVLVMNDNDILYRTEGFGGNDSKTGNDGRIQELVVPINQISGNSKINHSTMLSVEYKSRRIANKTLNLSCGQANNEIITFTNRMPCLYHSTVSPWSGGPEDDYVFKIMYIDYDNDTPEKVEVDIDGKLYPMTNNPNQVDFRNGTWFRYNTTLPIAEHKFRVITNDGLGFSDVSNPSGNDQYLSGPTVELQNTLPILSLGSVNPSSGNPDTVFSFRVKYNDPDGDPADIAKVYVDNIPFTMTKCDIDGSDGARASEQSVFYEFNTKLTIGTHRFFFKFSDDNSTTVIVWPQGDTDGEPMEITGPTVLDFKNHPAVLGNGTVTPTIGNRNTWFSYTISFYDPDDDDPSKAQVIIDGESFDLIQARIAQNIYFYESYLPLGNHLYHFEFWDSEHEHFVRFPEKFGVEILGPIVLDMPPQLASGNVTPAKGLPDTIFEFSIFYEDPDSDLPLDAFVIIDGRPYPMENKSIDSNRLLLSFSIKLPLGEHEYHFVIRSSDHLLRYPATGNLSGPWVTNKDDDEEPPNPEPNGTTEDPDNKSTTKGNVNKTNSTENNTENSTTKSIPNPGIQEEFKVLGYEVKESNGPLGIEYIFIIRCKIPTKSLSDSMCWLYINGDSYLMYRNKEDENNVSRFILNIKLLPGEHSIYFLFKLEDEFIRYPYLGEFPGPNVADPEATEGEQLTTRSGDGPVIKQFQILAVLILLLSFLVFSFYYTYFVPKKKNQ
jgi:hypothetical protein